MIQILILILWITLPGNSFCDLVFANLSETKWWLFDALKSMTRRCWHWGRTSHNCAADTGHPVRQICIRFWKCDKNPMLDIGLCDKSNTFNVWGNNFNNSNCSAGIDCAFDNCKWWIRQVHADKPRKCKMPLQFCNFKICGYKACADIWSNKWWSIAFEICALEDPQDTDVMLEDAPSDKHAADNFGQSMKLRISKTSQWPSNERATPSDNFRTLSLKTKCQKH